MTPNATFIKAEQRAKSTLARIWKDIAANYTVGWMMPIEVVIRQYPHIEERITNIRKNVADHLPTVLFQTREDTPHNMVTAIPYIKDNNPYNCHLVTTDKIPADQVQLLNDFAQAFWFLIDRKILPHPLRREALERKLVEFTDISLIAK